MSLETVVNDVKGRLETVGAQAQDVAEISLDTLKQANQIVVKGAQGLFKTHADTVKVVFDATKTSFEKALADGLKAVAADPVSYVPAGREPIVAAFNETVDTFTKTGEKLVKVIKKGYETVAATIAGEPVVVKQVKSTARKAVRKTTAAAKKAAA
jgi:predicted SnoaL-like aldol condensation-catalyzing enzyme